MSGGTLAWGCAAAALCFIAGLLAGMWIGYGRGFGHGTEEAGWQQDEAEARRPGPGKHRHPAGPPQHAARPAPVRPPAPEAPRPELPMAGYLPAPDGTGPWDGTITVAAPAQALPPWDTRPPEPQPQPEVLEPTAVLPGMPETDTAWTRRQAAEMQAFIDGLMARSESFLKEITR